MSANRELQFILSTFETNLQKLESSDSKRVKEAAILCRERLIKGEIGIAKSGGDLFEATTIGFDLTPHQTFREGFVGTLTLNVPKTSINMDPNILTAELTLAVGVANQYPDHGYERRFRQVYSDAQDLQNEWLDYERIFIPQLLTPALVGKERIFRRIVGDARYYCDTGFGDWKEFIDEFQQESTNPGDLLKMKQMRDSVSHFVVLRHRFAPIQYQSLTQSGHFEIFREESEDQKAKVSAAGLVGISLTGGNQISSN